jgi:hypothetical protein
MSEYFWKSKWSKEQVKTMLLEQFQTFWQRDTGIEPERFSEIERAASPIPLFTP